MTPSGTFSIVHVFTGADGADPMAVLIQATDGNFYGTTTAGGTSDLGTVFRMTPGGVVTTLHAFAGGADGANPQAALIQASDGNFYGTTLEGGIGWGTVFKMAPDGTLTILHGFDAFDGLSPEGSLIQATDGNFYGTTFGGGTSGSGTVFQMTPSGTLTVLHSFIGGTDGVTPVAPLIQAPDGNLYGTTSGGGTSGWGVVFGYGMTVTPPVIATQPQSQTISSGQTAILSVGAGGAPPSAISGTSGRRARPRGQLSGRQRATSRPSP
jgi:uncharacterized repeat protein (TIGR03803 family)